MREKEKHLNLFNLFSLIEGHLPEHPTQGQLPNKLFSDIFPQK